MYPIAERVLLMPPLRPCPMPWGSFDQLLTYPHPKTPPNYAGVRIISIRPLLPLPQPPVLCGFCRAASLGPVRAISLR
jgi:hypothetical protein